MPTPSKSAIMRLQKELKGLIKVGTTSHPLTLALLRGARSFDSGRTLGWSAPDLGILASRGLIGGGAGGSAAASALAIVTGALYSSLHTHVTSTRGSSSHRFT